MKKLLLAAGAAALAIAAPAAAEKGGKGGQGGGKGGGHAMKADRGGGGQSAKSDRRGGSKADRGERRSARADRAPKREKARVIRSARGNDRGELRGDDRVKPAKAVRVEQRGERDRDRDRGRTVRRDDDIRIVRDRDIDVVRYSSNDRVRGLMDGCPPGLAAKRNGCLPPGQARKLVGSAVPVALSSALLPSIYRNWYPDSDDYSYRSSGGYLYRIDRDDNLIDALLPLYDGYGYYLVGQRYPADYDFYNVPVQYHDYYADNDDWMYRYGDGAIYRVDRSNGVIDSIVALLAGDLGVGSALPVGYDVYNVPMAYRDRYYDTPDSWYRYNDGYIYQVDPQTRIIQAVIEALV